MNRATTWRWVYGTSVRFALCRGSDQGHFMLARPYSRVAFLFIALFGLLLGCGPPTPQERLADYRAAIASEWGSQTKPTPVPSAVLLPDRAARRIDVTAHRIGALDFLGIIGCRLSEVVAARNGSLGRVLVPTRRLAHELDVLAALAECLPELSGERATRLAALLEAKRGELGVHLWNAVWLDPELERYVSLGNPSLVGGESRDDGPARLRAAAISIAQRDALALERAFEQLRDDPPMGPMLRSMQVSTIELDRVSGLLSTLPESRCDARRKRLLRIFHERYVPIQPVLSDLDRGSRPAVDALLELYAQTADQVAPPHSMRAFAREIGGSAEASEPRLTERFRAAIVSHANAWQPIFEVCGVSPGRNG